MHLMLVILLILLLLGALPIWPYYAANWGWGPSGLLGTILIIILILWLLGAV